LLCSFGGREKALQEKALAAGESAKDKAGELADAAKAKVEEVKTAISK
jgi:uncharacterized protein YggE